MSTPTPLPDAEVKRLVRQHWAGRAPDFDAKPNHGLHSPAQRLAWLDVLRRVAAGAGPRALDVGCGTGFLALLLAELGLDVTGVDIAPEMVAQARAKAGAAGLAVEFRVGDADAVDAPAAAFDLVVERHVVWTLPDPARAVDGWARLLRPGGRLALFEGHFGAQQLRAEYEQIRDRLPFYGGRTADQLAGFLRERGLRDVAVTPLMDPVLWGDTPKWERYVVTATR